MPTSVISSNGRVPGRVTTFSVVVYVIVALILLWPLVRRLLPRRTVPGVLAEAAHGIEEAHHHGLTASVSARTEHGPAPRINGTERPLPRDGER